MFLYKIRESEGRRGHVQDNGLSLPWISPCDSPCNVQAQPIFSMFWTHWKVSWWNPFMLFLKPHRSWPPRGIDQVLDCKPLGCDIMSAVLPLLKGAACSEREGPGINGPGWQLEGEERDCICCLPAAHHQWFLQLCICLASMSRRSLPCLGCVIMGQKLIRAGDFPVES